MKCSKDDSGECCGKCGVEPKIIAVIPVFGRRELLKHTIERLYKKNGIYKVICVGHDALDQSVCLNADAEWIHHKNKPLGAKWNAGFQAAEKYNPDGCLFVGSSDWVSDNWLSEMTPHLKYFDLIGTPGCHFLHIDEDLKLCFWPGYKGRREGESIGIGRLISSKLLRKIQWKPFNSMLDNSLDFSMIENCTKVSGKIHLVDSQKIMSVSISTGRWSNKHNFLDHYEGRLVSEKIEDVDAWIKNNFPEAKLIFSK
jgi:hypothetical protein